MKLAIIANPISGGGRACKQLQRHIQAWAHADWEVEMQATKCAGHAGVLAREILDRQPDLLAVCGGDGTLNEVLSSVPEPPFPVAMIPAGTANVLARELSLPLNPIQALDIALKRVVRRVDLGILQGRQQHRFLLMAGIGLDAYVVSRMRPNKRRLGIASFYLASLRAFLSYSFTEFSVCAPDETLKATSCLISNTRCYGGGLVFTPEADMSDGLLDILILRGKPGIEHFRFIFSAWLGRPRPASCVQRRRLPALRVEGPRGLWVQTDGEPIGTLPIDVTLSHASFPLVVPV
ncbi:MAG: diacylglycerol kinase family lipid kinase [Acidobacteriia bacterium]|nr:diacylglycerol kinase family lipid kinase [Terriglobia bacterium]